MKFFYHEIVQFLSTHSTKKKKALSPKIRYLKSLHELYEAWMHKKGKHQDKFSVGAHLIDHKIFA